MVDELLQASRRRRAARLVVCGMLPLVACTALSTHASTPGPPPVQAAEPPAKAWPPVAVANPVSETIFGVTVTDYYRHFEDTRNPAVVEYMQGQSAFARATLDALPGHSALHERIDRLTASGVVISAVQLAGDAKVPQVFYFRQAPGDNARKLFARNGFGGSERMLFDPAALSSPGLRFAINSFYASPDGKVVAIAVAASGSEDMSLRVIDVATARDTGVNIDRIGFAAETKWLPDSSAFFYNRLPPQVASAPTNRYLRSRAYRHVPGRAATLDEPLFGPGIDTQIVFADIDIPSISANSDGKYLIAKIKHGDKKELSLFIAPANSLTAPPVWRKFADPRDAITAIAAHTSAIYYITHDDAPRSKLMRTGLQNPDIAKATTVVPHGDTVIRELAIAQDALYIRELYSGVDRLQRLNFSQTVYSGGKLEFVRLPFDLAIKQMVTDPKRPGALLRLEGWTEPPRYVNIEERSGNLIETHLQPKSAIDFSAIDEVRLMVTAKDGAKVPVTLMYKKGTTLDADHPTLLRAYGAYGTTQAPAFSVATMAWFERGGILGICHVRGGGEFGEAWHKAGQKLTKPNTWRDLIACGEYLIERKFTRKQKLAVIGGGAGGIAVGRAMTERPDLFAAVVSTVGVLDNLRAEFEPNGSPNVQEFGSVSSEDGFKGLLAMSSLHHVDDRVHYPATLLIHGVNDPRVSVWQSAKMAARLQASAAGLADVAHAKPVLLRLDYDAGHGIGSSQSQRNGELADIYSFLLWQFGDPAFQPRQSK